MNGAERLKRKIKMRITLDFGYVENVDGTCSPTRFYESHVHCRNGLEKYAAKIQEACVDAANKVLEEMKKKISNERK